MSDSKILFWDGHGSSARDSHISQVAKRANDIPASSVLRGNLDEIADQIAASGSVQVPVLDKENISFKRGTRTIERDDLWGERFRAEQSVIHFEVPFVGDRDIFKLRPNQFDSSPPYAEVRRESIVVTVVDENDPQVVKREIDSTLGHIERYLGWHKPLWDDVEVQIKRQALEILQDRKRRLEKEQSSDDALSAFGFKPKN